MAKEVETTKMPGMPTDIPDYGDDSGGGMEGVDREETRIPFIRVLQSNSPQVDASQGGILLEGAKPGMFIHMGTEELWPGDGSVEFITCFRDKDYVEWVPVDDGGGLIGRRGWDDPLVAELKDRQGKFGSLKTAEGTEINQTFYLFGILLPTDGAPRRIVLSFTSTQIKKYQAVIDRVESLKFIKDGKTVQPPLYAWRWKLSTGPEKNKKGSWFGIKIEPAGKTSILSLLPRNHELFALAREFNELLKNDGATAATEQMSNSIDDAVEHVPSETSVGRDLDDEIPPL